MKFLFTAITLLLTGIHAVNAAPAPVGLEIESQANTTAAAAPANCCDGLMNPCCNYDTCQFNRDTCYRVCSGMTCPPEFYGCQAMCFAACDTQCFGF